ncbi:chromate transporter [Longibacter salinarum]|uniref:Chromate transporter n=1 Tax=Longibacter salinarum TaxID=1850348 RepID=A0A2A8CYU1_9BACT|nr:chromate efflux transporter [Longibacter salinarum]PEN13899.1 chromate transporter [Longibacter salinarum]
MADSSPGPDPADARASDSTNDTSTSDTDETSLVELARLFFKLGVIAFGGPAAHIAMMEDEIVKRRGWMSRQHFLDLIGATNLIPGPNSTEMTMHVGFERRGWPGLFTTGACFIFPAAVLTGTLAWLYVQYGQLPNVEPFLIGIKPAVLAVIVGALWRLGDSALKSWKLVPIAIGVAALLVLGVGEIWSLLAGGVIGMLALVGVNRLSTSRASWFLLVSPVPLLSSESTSPTLTNVFLFFLKVGAILYGSGYVLVAFLEGSVVGEYGWMTQQQLLDAIAAGQFTPGPVLTTSTFIGFVVMAEQGLQMSLAGAAVATLGIFLPSFIFVALLNPIVPRLRDSIWSASFMDAVNVSAVALMAVVSAELGLATLTSLPNAIVFLLAMIAVFALRLSSLYIVLGGALIGYLLTVM